MSDFAALLLNYRLAVAQRAALVRQSFSAGGSEYLTRRINEATDTARKAEDALTAFVSKGPSFSTR